MKFTSETQILHAIAACERQIEDVKREIKEWEPEEAPLYLVDRKDYYQDELAELRIQLEDFRNADAI